MYETSFGMTRRPFAATPDATCFLTAGPIQAAFDELVVCVEQGQGIAVLTAPAGTGKTLLCERLRGELDDRFETVFLRHASFLTRRALLQTILCELNHAYHHPSEQELRLELLPAIRALQPKREALVLICDEAHQLTDSLIEELRILADFAEAGRPLVRLVLVGQLSLEEKLAQPNLEAFNQRIRAHVNLPTFDRAGSQDYIDYRLTWAGGRTDEIFTPAALNLIAQVSDGIPRCINQLADHTLLLAFVAEQCPAGEELVREALNDLRQLPLHWNEPSSSRTSENGTLSNSDDEYGLESHSESSLDSDSSGFLRHSIPQSGYSYEPSASEADTPGIRGLTSPARLENGSSFEIGAAVSQTGVFETADTPDQISVEIGSDDWQQTIDLFRPGRANAVEINGQFHDLVHDSYLAAERANRSKTGEGHSDSGVNQGLNTLVASDHSMSGACVSNLSTISSGQQSSIFREEIIVDRYVSIDAGFSPVAAPNRDTAMSAEVHAESTTLPNRDVQTSDRIGAGNYRNDDFSDLDTNFDFVPMSRIDKTSASTDPLDRVLHSVHDLIDVMNEKNDSTESKSSAVHHDEGSPYAESVGFRAPETSEAESGYRLAAPAIATAWEAVETEPVEVAPKSRPFRYLFSTLRRKQQELT